MAASYFMVLSIRFKEESGLTTHEIAMAFGGVPGAYGKPYRLASKK
jgi:hypothetical protein